MTIVIYNNSTEFNIYPVLFAGAPSDTDQWMQACFKVPPNQIQPKDNFPYPRASQYRMYINCCAPGENGLPPQGSVTIRLPFYSPLVAVIDPTVKGARPIHRLVARRRYQHLPGPEDKPDAADDRSSPLDRRHQRESGRHAVQ
jgi:hypothetical protein